MTTDDILSQVCLDYLELKVKCCHEVSAQRELSVQLQ